MKWKKTPNQRQKKKVFCVIDRFFFQYLMSYIIIKQQRKENTIKVFSVWILSPDIASAFIWGSFIYILHFINLMDEVQMF